ncbi:MAG TPA: translation initiation factor IF-2, partial [Flavobacteriales bacterium]|nr:translation initiation factor IF-2 [Flavobacteriales bacterium]
MAEGAKIRRLSKVAKELNIGLATMFDFLSSKDVEIEKSPNAKISSDVYEMLLNEFQSEKAVKEGSKLLGLDKPEMETITLVDSGAKEKQKASEEIIPTKVDEKVSSMPEEKTEVGPKVVGKIDIDKVAEKKKTPAKTVSDTEDKTKEEKPPSKKDDEKKPEVTKLKKVPVQEVIEAKPEKLAGPKVVGAIDLPVEKPPPKKLVASSSDNQKIKKKKRRRIFKNDKGEKKSTAGDQESRKKPAKELPTEEDIQKQIKETLSRLSDTTKSKGAKYRKRKREAISDAKEKELEILEAEKSTISVTEFVSANELSKLIDVPINDILKCCMDLGLFVSINQRLDAETLSLVSEEFGYNVNFISAELSEEIVVEEDLEEDLAERPPIVTVMGHVDHGKTSLLDNIRKSNVIEGEAGGITQHIGAYAVTLENGKNVTFLDTPGHEAFTAMRARGAQVTDVVIVIIAADDNIMPQTVEAINHAQAAGVPIVIAINKIDKSGADTDKIKEELSKMNILVEDWGGKYQCQEISAKKGTNIGELLEKVVLEAEVLELKANPKKRAAGTVIESSLDKGKGYITTLLVQNGTLKVGDIMAAGCFSGRVKALFNERGEKITSVGPATPVMML